MVIQKQKIKVQMYCKQAIASVYYNKFITIIYDEKMLIQYAIRL